MGGYFKQGHHLDNLIRRVQIMVNSSPKSDVFGGCYICGMRNAFFCASLCLCCVEFNHFVEWLQVGTSKYF